MLVKILGAFDIFVAVILFLAAINISISTKLIIVLIVILAAKSIPNMKSLCIASFLDIFIIIILVICIFTPVNTLILLIATFVIAQKGVRSFL